MTAATKPGVPPGPVDALWIIALVECDSDSRRNAAERESSDVVRPRQDALALLKTFGYIALVMAGLALTAGGFEAVMGVGR